MCDSLAQRVAELREQGYSDYTIGRLLDIPESAAYRLRKRLGLTERVKRKPEAVYGPDCRRCGRKLTKSAKKGLCFGCYNTPGVRTEYVSLSRFTPDYLKPPGAVDPTAIPDRDPGSDPLIPCPHRPGTPQKIAWLAARATAGLRLWHPHDC